MKPRLRFAPSPTGQLHLGGARTALTNYLYAKNHGGKFLVRIEDTDLERSKKEYIDQITDSLKWLGLDWDEELVYQSTNSSSYQASLDVLMQSKKAYKCFASKEELDVIRKKSNSFHYNGLWRDRGDNEVNEELSKGTPFTIRLKTPLNEYTEFNDLIYGKITVSNSEIDDFIIARSDGTPVYNFTNVVDDKAMDITHVIRGEDHVPNTAKQILIYEALGHDIPQFAHLPMILGEDKKRLSKRHGATGVYNYKERGYQSAALLNYLALLGWNPGTDQEIFTLPQLVKEFELSKVQKKSAIFDQKKFNWVSSQHLMLQHSSNLLVYVKEIDGQWGLKKDEDYCVKVIDLMKPRSDSLRDLIDQSSYFFFQPQKFDQAELAKIWKEDTLSIMLELKSIIESIDDFVSSSLEIKFNEYMDKTGMGFGKVMKPLRFILCGILMGPSLYDIIELLGKEESINRINIAISEFE